MSLETSHQKSVRDHIVRPIDGSGIDRRRLRLSKIPTGSGENGVMLALIHLDLALAVEVQPANAETSSDDATSFRVSAKRLAGASAETDDASAAGEFTDPVMRRLSDALAITEAAHDFHSAILADALRLAILTRRFSRHTAERRTEADATTVVREDHAGRAVRSLQKWRLNRVLQYVDDHLSAKITLQDLASVAGLSRMHFAAQFRAAIGLRPHDYLLKRRIERAQELLKQSNVSLVDVALTVGFQTQAHFTTVFKRFTGDTPHQWRSAYLARCMAGRRAGESLS
ncbi:helix-turn-helix domain-containing protein [Bradyrhizobium sp. STM 3557]|uniref:helix-turn-helix domain-containing protein n=1 Tax=Bradyrhizobium sp. STM 3557 TaxID=578920 RepID=UPI00388ED4F0